MRVHTHDVFYDDFVFASVVGSHLIQPQNRFRVICANENSIIWNQFASLYENNAKNSLKLSEKTANYPKKLRIIRKKTANFP